MHFSTTVCPRLGDTLTAHLGDQLRRGILSNLNPIRVFVVETGAEESFPAFSRGCEVTVEPAPAGRLVT